MKYYSKKIERANFISIYIFSKYLFHINWNNLINRKKIQEFEIFNKNPIRIKKIPQRSKIIRVAFIKIPNWNIKIKYYPCEKMDVYNRILELFSSYRSFKDTTKYLHHPLVPKSKRPFFDVFIKIQEAETWSGTFRKTYWKSKNQLNFILWRWKLLSSCKTFRFINLFCAHYRCYICAIFQWSLSSVVSIVNVKCRRRFISWWNVHADIANRIVVWLSINLRDIIVIQPTFIHIMKI